MTKPSPDARPYVGGQAVIEGVMMKAPGGVAIAVRRAGGAIVVREDRWRAPLGGAAALRWPLIRGAVTLVESLYNGLGALQWSADQAALDADETDGPPTARDAESSGARVEPEPEQRPSVRVEPAEPERRRRGAAATLALSLGLAFALFKGLPHFLAVGAGQLAPGEALDVTSFAFHLLDGVFKLSIFVGYLTLISRIPEVRRVFQYHGAEHKAINTWEAAEPLSVERARRHPTFHPRCGTSFVLFVLVLSIVLFAGVFPFVPRLFENTLLHHLSMLALKLPMMLPLAGVAYELNRLAGRHIHRRAVRWLVAPGAWVQRITTREPDDEQLEIALTALRAALAVAPEDAPARAAPRVYRDYGEVSAVLTEPA